MPGLVVLIIKRKPGIIHIFLKDCYVLGAILSYLHTLLPLIFVTDHKIDLSLSSILCIWKLRLREVK